MIRQNRHDRRAAASSRGEHRARLDRNKLLSAPRATAEESLKKTIREKLQSGAPLVTMETICSIAEARSPAIDQIFDEEQRAGGGGNVLGALLDFLCDAAESYVVAGKGGDTAAGIVAVADVLNAAIASAYVRAQLPQHCDCDHCKAIRAEREATESK